LWDLAAFLPDEEGVREVVAEALTHAGYTVRIAGGVAQALAAVKHDPIHLLVTDLVMQDGSGQDLAYQLSQTNPMMKVLFMSGYSQNLVVDWRLQGTSFLQKPFDLDNLICKAQEILETRTAESLTGPNRQSRSGDRGARIRPLRIPLPPCRAKEGISGFLAPFARSNEEFTPWFMEPTLYFWGYAKPAE
jgi:DNA-binding NtrC family response regulator